MPVLPFLGNFVNGPPDDPRKAAPWGTDRDGKDLVNLAHDGVAQLLHQDANGQMPIGRIIKVFISDDRRPPRFPSRFLSRMVLCTVWCVPASFAYL